MGHFARTVCSLVDPQTDHGDLVEDQGREWGSHSAMEPQMRPTKTGARGVGMQRQV